MNQHQRLDQILQTARRARPMSVGVWGSAENLPESPADVMMISPVDLQWLTEQIRPTPAEFNLFSDEADKLLSAHVREFVTETDGRRSVIEHTPCGKVWDHPIAPTSWGLRALALRHLRYCPKMKEE